MVPMKTNAAKSWLFDKTVGDMFDAACQKVWNAIVSMLQQVMGFMDKVGHVNVQTTAGNPLAQVYPVTMWIGAALAILLGIMGAGAFAWTKGRNGAQMLTGFVKFAVGWAAALTLVNLLAGVADQLAVGILRTGRISGWSAVAGQQSWLANLGVSSVSAGGVVAG